MNFKRLFFLTVFCLSSTLMFSQNNDTDEKISIIKLTEDLEILKNNLEAIHAGLYNYTSKDIIYKKFDEIKSQITEPLTSIEFYRLIVPLHRYIKNGHTIIIPSESFDNATATTTLVLPLDVYWYDESVYLLRNNSNNLDIPIGVKIDSINGENASSIFIKMSKLWTRDGSNITFPEGITQRAFAGFYINFIGSPETYNITYSDSSGHSKRTKLKALTTPEIDKNREERYGDIHHYWQKGDGDAVSLEINGNVAHLKIKTCANSDIRKFGQSIKGIMKRFFKKIEQHNVEHLIIDLRNNGGGDEIISRELFKNIAQEPFTLFKDSYLLTRKIPNKELYIEKVGKMNAFGKIGLCKGKDGFYRLNSFGRMIFRSSNRFKAHKPIENNFKGKIYTLTNAYSFSAAGEMAASLKTNTNSIFIGEEPGGNSHKVVAGEIFTLVLPNSKNRIRIPVANQIVNSIVKPVDRGVIPDYKVRNTIDDMINGKDAALEFTYELIKNKK